jgi:NADPH-dependent curcumin reductase CurA
MCFENVGGAFFEAAFDCLGNGGRIAVCGGISLYQGDAAVPPAVSVNPMQMIYTAQRVEGFVCTPWLTGKRGDWLAKMLEWKKAGWLVAEETAYDGIEAYPEAFAALFTGDKKGKVVVKVQ